MFIDKTETKSGYVKGPEREDLVKWVGIAWRSMTSEIITKAFKKARLLEYYEGNKTGKIQVDNAMLETSDATLEDLDFDNPYLDDMEEEYIDHSELKFEED